MIEYIRSLLITKLRKLNFTTKEAKAIADEYVGGELKGKASHGSDQRTLYGPITFSLLKDLRTKVRRWNTAYNNLEHCGLNGKTPNTALADYQLIGPLNVLA